jgi:hypothetical protein
VRNLLAEAVAQMHLEPGETYRTTVNGIEVELRRPAAVPAPEIAPENSEEPRAADPDEEPSQFADMVMLMPWFESPPPQRLVTVKAKFGPLPFPDPPIIPSDDEVAE